MPLWRSWLRRDKDWRAQHAGLYKEPRGFRALNGRPWGAVRRPRLVRHVVLPVLAAVIIGAAYGTLMRMSPWSQVQTLRHVAAYPSCAFARMVDLAPAYRGEPGYYQRHDWDGNGRACEPPQPSIVFVQGIYTGANRADAIAPFSIKVSPGKKYYIKLVRENDGTVIMTMLVSSSLEMKAPLGRYKLAVATGETWYGWDRHFGENTVYYETGVLEFYRNGNGVQGSHVELIDRVDGNLGKVPIARGKFGRS